MPYDDRDPADISLREVARFTSGKSKRTMQVFCGTASEPRPPVPHLAAVLAGRRCWIDGLQLPLADSDVRGAHDARGRLPAAHAGQKLPVRAARAAAPFPPQPHRRALRTAGTCP